MNPDVALAGIDRMLTEEPPVNVAEIFKPDSLDEPGLDPFEVWERSA